MLNLVPNQFFIILIIGKFIIFATQILKLNFIQSKAKGDLIS